MSYKTLLLPVKALLLLFSLSFLCLSAKAQPEWQTVYPFENYLDITDGVFLPGGTYIAAGKLGRVMQSSDAGQNWNYIELPTEDEMQYVREVPGSGQQAFIIGSRTTLYATNDGGISWQEIESAPLFDNIRDIHFASADVAMICDADGKLYRSTDAGQTWTTVLETEDFGRNCTFVDSNTGWMVTLGGVVYATEDAGASWDSIYITPDESAQWIDFLDSNTGFIIDNDENVLSSTDGGETWTSMVSDGLPTANIKFQAADASKLYAFGGNTLNFYSSEDGGALWTSYQVADYVYNDMNSMYLDEDGTIWMVGENQVIAKSEDEGQNWTDIFAAEKANLENVAMLNEEVGFAGGAGYNILKTEMGGESWAAAGNQGPLISDIEADANGTLYYSRGYSGLFRSQDEGQSWEQVLDGVSFVRNVGISPNGVVYASTAIAESCIHRSEDQGETWIAFETPNEVSARGFSFASNEKGFAWEDDQLLQTTDGGTSWELVESPGSSSISDVFFLDENTGWLYQQGGGIYKTLDGGMNWSVLSGAPLNINAILFKDENTGWLAGRGDDNTGSIYYSENGGQSWSLAYQASYEFNDLIYSDKIADELVAVGNGGIIAFASIPITIGTDEFVEKEGQLNIFPNPGDESLYLDHQFEDGHLLVYNQQGQLMQEVYVGKSENVQLDMQAFPSGTYIIRALDKEKSFSAIWVKL
ncbi:MAG: T9SS type A sorting domain-containing protein [Bacteroidetes bacterium]|nr:T9SS type A sorting domain-containing protein [Bacteroidota bacterium]